MKNITNGEGELTTEDESTEMYNWWMRSLKEVQDDDRIDKKRMGELYRGMGQLTEILYDFVLNKWGEEGGGKWGFEWNGNYGNCGPNRKEKKRASWS